MSIFLKMFISNMDGIYQIFFPMIVERVKINE